MMRGVMYARSRSYPAHVAPPLRPSDEADADSADLARARRSGEDVVTRGRGLGSISRSGERASERAHLKMPPNARWRRIAVVVGLTSSSSASFVHLALVGSSSSESSSAAAAPPSTPAAAPPSSAVLVEEMGSARPRWRRWGRRSCASCRRRRHARLAAVRVEGEGGVRERVRVEARERTTACEGEGAGATASRREVRAAVSSQNGVESERVEL